MKKSRKILSVLIAVFMLTTALLSGCGKETAPAVNSPDNTAVASNSATPSEESKPVEKTKIEWWQFWNILDEEDSIKPSIDAFMAANPDIVVEATKLGWGDGLTKIQTSIGAGAAPDVLELGSTWVGMFSQSGALADLTAYVTPEIKDKFVNWNLGEYDGKIYAFPWAVGTRGLAVNYDLFEQAGLDPTKPPKDWNELISYAKTIKEKCGVPGFGIEAGDPTGDYQIFMSFAYSAGATMIGKNAEGKEIPGIDSDGVRKAIKLYKDLIPYGIVDKEANLTLAFQNNELGMYAIGSYLTPAMEKQGLVENWGYEQLPACPDTGKTMAFNGAEVLSVLQQSDNKEAAFKLLLYLADEQTALTVCKTCGWSIVPSTKTAADLDVFKNPGDDDAARRVTKFIDIMKAGNTWAPPLHKYVEDVGMRISTMVQEIYLNNKDSEQAITDCANDINRLYLNR